MAVQTNCNAPENILIVQEGTDLRVRWSGNAVTYRLKYKRDEEEAWQSKTMSGPGASGGSGYYHDEVPVTIDDPTVSSEADFLIENVTSGTYNLRLSNICVDGSDFLEERDFLVADEACGEITGLEVLKSSREAIVLSWDAKENIETYLVSYTAKDNNGLIIDNGNVEVSENTFTLNFPSYDRYVFVVAHACTVGSAYSDDLPVYVGEETFDTNDYVKNQFLAPQTGGLWLKNKAAEMFFDENGLVTSSIKITGLQKSATAGLFVVANNGQLMYRTAEEMLTDLAFEESDPLFAASPAAGITDVEIAAWDAAVNWGNHAGLYVENQTEAAQAGGFWMAGNGIIEGNLRVGVTTDSGQKVQVNGTVKVTADTTAGLDFKNTAGTMGFEFSTNSNTPRIDFLVNGNYTGGLKSDTTYDVLLANNYAGGSLQLQTTSVYPNTTTVMKLFSSGNILIQTGGTFTDNGLDKLQVNGSIKAIGYYSNNRNVWLHMDTGGDDYAKFYFNGNNVRTLTLANVGNNAYLQALTFNGALASEYWENLIISTWNGAGPHGGNIGFDITGTRVATINSNRIFLIGSTTEVGTGIKFQVTGTSYFNSKILIGDSTDKTGQIQLGGSHFATNNLFRSFYIGSTLNASANGDVLVGIDIDPVFSTGILMAKTIALRVVNGDVVIAPLGIGGETLLGVDNEGRLIRMSGITNLSESFIANQFTEMTIGSFWIDGPGILRQLAIGIGGNSNPSALWVSGAVVPYLNVARGFYLTNTLFSANNNDLLIAMDVQPIFTLGHTGVKTVALRTGTGDVVHQSLSGINDRYVIARSDGTLASSTEIPPATSPVPSDEVRMISFSVDKPAGITSGVISFAAIPFDGYITGWQIVSDFVGMIVIDVWKQSYDTFVYPGSAANSITGSEPITLTGQNKNRDMELTTWTTAVSEGDMLTFNVNSAATVKKIFVTIFLREAAA